MVKQLTGAEDEEEDGLKDCDENVEDCNEDTSDAEVNPKKQITLLSTRVRLMLGFSSS